MNENVLETNNEYKEWYFDFNRVPYVFREVMTSDWKLEVHNTVINFYKQKENKNDK